MKNILIFLFGVFSYLVALVGQIWFILYLSNLDTVGNTIYAPQHTSLYNAILINTFLVLLFGLQHSVMARGWFKKRVNAVIPQSAERSMYVLLSGVVFILICIYWQPIDGTLWHIKNDIIKYILWGGFLFGWIFSVVATFVINHFELFGLQQVYHNLRNIETKEIEFKEKFFYKFVRHPIQLGVLIGLWITPMMTYGHLLLSILFTLYIFIGLYYEEKDLVKELGDVYAAYKQRVGMMIPVSRKRNK